MRCSFVEAMPILRTAIFTFSAFGKRGDALRLGCQLRGARTIRLYTLPNPSPRVYRATRNLPFSTARSETLQSIPGVSTHLVLLKSPFHTTPRRPAPQFLLLLFGPLSRFMVAVGGRLTRSWWTRLAPERRAAIKSSIRKNAKYFYAVFGFLSLCGFGFYATHLEETPITRRRRFIMFPREEVVKMIESERNNILEAICKADVQMLLSHDHPVYKRVHRIVSQILAGNNVPEFEGFNWGLYVIDKPDFVNALCLPTGDIFVYTGLVNQCRNDEELAFILSHEIAHTVLGHGVEALTTNGVVNFLQLFLIAAIWAVIPSNLLSYFMRSFSRSTVQVMLEYPHSRKLETEADKVSFSANN